MERLTVTLEDAKHLKTAGFPQNTIYFWHVDPQRNYLDTSDEEWQDIGLVYAAPTAQEIANQLPVPTSVSGWTCGRVSGDSFGAIYQGIDDIKSGGDTLAQALAWLWIKLRAEAPEAFK